MPGSAHAAIAAVIASLTLFAAAIPVATGSSGGNDRDRDGMPDTWERQHGVFIATADEDGDSLSNADEFRIGSDPRNPDSDGDGERDGDDLALVLALAPK